VVAVATGAAVVTVATGAAEVDSSAVATVAQ
jgi:hypothetical protein